MRIVLSMLMAMLLGSITTTVYAEPEPELGAVALHQALLDVGTDLRLMCVATHPDDEDGATLTYYRKKFGYKTFAVIATRGEGGQNEIGPELYEELGVIRTHEMMRASEHTGAVLQFLNYPEFGYSKSAEEAFEVWGKEETVRRMVGKIRLLKPDVIITHHDETSGHGHHQAVGRALMEAFDLAGDPKAFPEEGKPWQPARLYWRDFAKEKAPDTVTVPFSELDPVRGVTYAEMAANALREHKSQGMEYFINFFIMNRVGAHYTLVKEYKGGVQGAGELDAPSGELFSGLKDRVSKGGRTLANSGVGELNTALIHDFLQDVPRRELINANTLATTAAGWKLSTELDDDVVTPGQSFSVQMKWMDYGALDGVVQGFTLNRHSPFSRQDTEVIKPEKIRDSLYTGTFTVMVPDDAPVTLPHEDYLFDPRFLAYQMTVYAIIDSDTGALGMRATVRVDIAPPVGIEYLNAPYLVQQRQSTAEVSLVLTNYTPGANEVVVELSASKGIELATKTLRVSFANEDEEKVITVPALIESGLATGDYSVTARIPENDYEASGTIRVVDYDVPEDIKVGVIQSYDDTFLTTLERMGIPHEALEKDDFSAAKLDEFSTIIVDIRAYLVRKDLIANNQAVLDYVKRGGTVLVMYQKTFEWKESFAPYPITLSRNRVTREDAPITVLEPKHSLFTTPNVMSAGDWDGWRQERGLYFPSKWDEAYTPLIDVQDPGETNPPGSLLVAEYGEGVYMYTALGWYRQLRELHPGTVRMFANMLAL